MRTLEELPLVDFFDSDMVTALVQAEEGDDRLSDDEVMSMISALLFASNRDPKPTSRGRR